MKINANTLKSGNCIEHKSELYYVVKIEHIKPGKGGAFAQTELKSLKNGTKLNERFRSAESVEKVYLDEKQFQFLYSESDNINVMDQSTFEQILVPLKFVKDIYPYLEEEMSITICFHDDKIVYVKIPENVTATVEQTEPVIKKQTATSSFKPAILTNGLRINVPQHINPQDKIIVSTTDNTYVEKAKK